MNTANFHATFLIFMNIANFHETFLTELMIFASIIHAMKKIKLQQEKLRQ